MDVTLVRILTVLISLFTGVPVILYIIALFVMPEGATVRRAAAGDRCSPYAGRFSGPQSATPPPAYAPFPTAGAQKGAATIERPTAEDAVWGTRARRGSSGSPIPRRRAAPAASPRARAVRAGGASGPAEERGAEGDT